MNFDNVDGILVQGGAFAIGGAILTKILEYLINRNRGEISLTLSAREELQREAASIRNDLRIEIKDLKEEVRLLREENLQLREERLDGDRRHRAELLEWQARYQDLESKYKVAMRLLERTGE